MSYSRFDIYQALQKDIPYKGTVINYSFTMSQLNSHHLYVLADGHHFLLMARDSQKTMDHLKIVRRVQYHPSEFESKKRDHPGKTMNRARDSHTSYAHSDLSTLADGRYLELACRSIDSVFQKGGYEAIMLIGEPKFIHQIKQHLSPQMKAHVKGEIHKNYAKLPIEKLEQTLLHLH